MFVPQTSMWMWSPSLGMKRPRATVNLRRTRMTKAVWMIAWTGNAPVEAVSQSSSLHCYHSKILTCLLVIREFEVLMSALPHRFTLYYFIYLSDLVVNKIFQERWWLDIYLKCYGAKPAIYLHTVCGGASDPSMFPLVKPES